MFTTSCFIRKNTPELRKKLEGLGYKMNLIYSPNEQNLYISSGVYSSANFIDNYYLDCETNEELFLALAALRDDTDKYQWVIDEANECFGWENSWSICDKDDMNESVVYTHYRKATVEEIIEHFKDKMIMNVPENMKQITDLASQLVKEESSAVNPILPQDNLFAMQGWQCPICKRVYSPFTHMCIYCGNKEVETITLPNTGGLPQEQKSNFRNQTTSK